jgi:hypothetical protein
MQAKGVTQLVNGFFQQALLQQLGVPSQPIKFLMKTVRRHKRAGASDLCLTENVLQDGNVQVDIRYGQQSPAAVRDLVMDALQNLRRVKLLSFHVIRSRGIQRRGKNFAPDRQVLRQRIAQALQQRLANRTHRKQVHKIHGDPLAWR